MELPCSLTREQTAQYDAATELWQARLCSSSTLHSFCNSLLFVSVGDVLMCSVSVSL